MLRGDLVLQVFARALPSGQKILHFLQEWRVHTAPDLVSFGVVSVWIINILTVV
jgi:hypothetical protein